jgi:Trk-type K+ transport system membrane component
VRVSLTFRSALAGSSAPGSGATRDDPLPTFGLFSDSLSRWVGDPSINLVMPGLFIIGGIGYAVLADLGARRKWRPLTLHSKLMLSGTAVLIVWSMAASVTLEWSNPATLGGLDGIGERLVVMSIGRALPLTLGFFLDTRTAPRVRYLSSEDCLG